MSALHTSCALPPEGLLIPISVRGSVNLRSIVWLEGLGKLKNITVTSSGLEPTAFWLVA
jgi:hypothetical protein